MDIQTKNALKIAGGVLAAIWGVAAATANSSRGSGYDPRSYTDTPDTEPRAISLTEAREPGSTHVPYSPPQPSWRPRIGRSFESKVCRTRRNGALHAGQHPDRDRAPAAFHRLPELRTVAS